MAARWYVVHVYSGFEKKVAQSIEEKAKQLGMEERIQEVLIPMEEVVEMRRGSKVNSERKFFPGYVLVKMDISDESWHLIKNTPKVTDFLGSKGRPQPISDAEAERIIFQVKEGVELGQHNGFNTIYKFSSEKISGDTSPCISTSTLQRSIEFKSK